MSGIRWTGNGICKTGETVMYFSGTIEQDTNYRHGVAIMIDAELNRCVTNFIPLSERCVFLQLKGNPFNINSVQVYAPTSGKSDTEVEEFYNHIQEINDITIVMGDFNAKIGSQKFENLVGGYD